MCIHILYIILYVVVQSPSHVRLCDHTDCSTPGLPVPHHLLEFAQVHVHYIGDAVQPSHPLMPSSPSALNLSQHQGLFQWVICSHQMTKILECQLHTHMHIYLYIENHEFKPIPQFQTNTTELILVFSFSLFPTMRNLFLSLLYLFIHSVPQKVTNSSSNQPYHQSSCRCPIPHPAPSHNECTGAPHTQLGLQHLYVDVAVITSISHQDALSTLTSAFTTHGGFHRQHPHGGNLLLSFGLWCLLSYYPHALWTLWSTTSPPKVGGLSPLNFKAYDKATVNKAVWQA